MTIPISLVVPDAGPLISLAMADRLDILDAFSVPIAALDVVKAECLFREWPGRASLERWFETNEDRLEIIESPFLPLYLKSMSAEASHQAPAATRGLGDASIAWFVANAPYIRQRTTTLLVLTEDASFGDAVLGRDVHVLSTRAFLQTLEALDIIVSSKDVLDEIARRGRNVAPYMADRPALGGAGGRKKSSWKAALRARS